MIRILRAPLAVLTRTPSLSRRDPSTIRIDVDPRFPIPWGGARSLLAQLRQRLGDEVVERAINPHRALLSLTLHRLDASLTEDERAQRERLRAQTLGFMSHSRLTAVPLVDAWRTALIPLVRACASSIIIPNVAGVDQNSMALFRQLLQRLPAEERPDFILGHSPAIKKPDQAGRRLHAWIDMQMAFIEELGDATVEVLSEDTQAPATGTEVVDIPLDPLDDDMERRAWDALTSAPGAPGEALQGQVLSAMRASFGAFAFEPTALLGAELLSRATQLSKKDLAEAHTLVALAIHARGFLGRDRATGEALTQHLRAALTAEDDPLRRSHLFYRLCINTGRGAGDLEGAMGLAERAIEEARAPNLPPALAAYVEAWARNGLAYLLSRQRRFQKAFEECSYAAALVDRAASLSGVPEREVFSTRIVLFDNLAELALRGRDHERASHWQRRLEEADRDLVGVMRYSSHRWPIILRSQGRLKEAIERAREGLDIARQHGNPFAEDRFNVDLADLLYRVGDAMGAHRHFTASLSIRRKLGEPEEVAQTELSIAAVALRAGRLDEAKAGLEHALSSPLGQRATTRAEILATLALTAARQGEGARAEQLINAAIAEAASSGERDTLARVARSAGEVCLSLGMHGEARDAFQRALQIAAAGDANGPPGAAADVLGALLGLKSAGSDAPELVLRALAIAPDALDDAEAWWDIPCLLRGITSLLGRVDISLDVTISAAAERVLRAGAQRIDVDPALLEIVRSALQSTS